MMGLHGLLSRAMILWKRCHFLYDGGKTMKVAIVHYWLVGMRGGEKVVEQLCALYPQADIFTHVVRREAMSEAIRRHTIRTSFIQRLPWATRFYQHYLPLMPLALEELDLTGYDLVISSESGPAKGVITAPGSLHVCYCHSPMRYLWDMYHAYMAGVSWPLRWIIAPLWHRLRVWDVVSAARVDHFIANSDFVRRRIDKTYRRPAHVIHPPVDTSRFTPAQSPGEFFLFVSQLVPYKRADLAIAAFTRLGLPLVVIGTGSEEKRLKAIAGDNIRFLGWQSNDVLREHYQRCRALIFPGEEDFGIVPVEAMACGRPVIAFGRGGARETVVDGETGLFFAEQSVDALVGAVERFQAAEAGFDANAIALHAQNFSEAEFRRRFAAQIERWRAAAHLVVDRR
jgi:glycosyltransferase involved in cell wall biosynthesis